MLEAMPTTKKRPPHTVPAHDPRLPDLTWIPLGDLHDMPGDPDAFFDSVWCPATQASPLNLWPVRRALRQWMALATEAEAREASIRSDFTADEIRQACNLEGYDLEECARIFPGIGLQPDS